MCCVSMGNACDKVQKVSTQFGFCVDLIVVVQTHNTMYSMYCVLCVLLLLLFIRV